MWETSARPRPVPLIPELSGLAPRTNLRKISLPFAAGRPGLHRGRRWRFHPPAGEPIPDGAALRRVLRGIIEQCSRVRVSARRSARTGNSRAPSRSRSTVARAGRRLFLKLGDGLGGDAARILRAQVIRFATAFHPPEVQQRFHQPAEAFGVAPQRRVERFAPFGAGCLHPAVRSRVAGGSQGRRNSCGETAETKSAPEPRDGQPRRITRHSHQLPPASSSTIAANPSESRRSRRARSRMSAAPPSDATVTVQGRRVHSGKLQDSGGGRRFAARDQAARFGGQSDAIGRAGAALRGCLNPPIQ